ncbi:late embryogenesis abundant protein At5g17165-like isoform X2 [Olea europaea var. sylvestris]|uniref:late embryogenesis abundant protein At5g17165-like isoform X2 n=1 Tax=Olea europaea var. sylvestris TaxID=158386 RepID=UPI000C1D4485|nr:late embryogenesis abundant protein At5g17165-like isoform X2 [Olea europaea var. sylvestris]
MTARGVHVSVYSKNVEENVVEENAQAAAVPDDVISPLSDEYWEPHPETGVFGPATDNDKSAMGGEPLSANGDSVLEKKAFFRPLEDLDVPPPELRGGIEDSSTIDKA